MILPTSKMFQICSTYKEYCHIPFSFIFILLQTHIWSFYKLKMKYSSAELLKVIKRQNKCKASYRCSNRFKSLGVISVAAFGIGVPSSSWQIDSRLFRLVWWHLSTTIFTWPQVPQIIDCVEIWTLVIVKKKNLLLPLLSCFSMYVWGLSYLACSLRMTGEPSL